MHYGESTSSRVEEAAKQVVDSIFKVYETLGPGLLEAVYEVCLEYELKKRGMAVRRQVSLPVRYDGIELDAAYRIDLLVNDCVLVEVKAVEKLIPVHDAQVLTYLKLSGLTLGILVNFNARYLKDQLKRVVLSAES
jgi:GxxExxY protein